MYEPKIAYALIERPDLVAGVLKFTKNVELWVIFELAARWAREEPERLPALSVRAYGKDLVGIEFRYRYPGKSHTHEMHRVGQWMEEHVGKENFCGWNATSPVYVMR